ncbi:MAG: energy-coupling factor transporter transmembrane protein EcfT [Oscillospiraceae bacterium]|nr:energy-coupling factor transporter transmembrane protein EcfT [Oscillospiraceae bacterium]
MISDITIGQYYAGHSVLHRLDPRIKLILTLFFMVVIFMSRNFLSLGLIALGSIALAVLSRVPAKTLLRSFRPILVLVLFTSILNLLYTQKEDAHILLAVPIFRWMLTITREGVFAAIFTTARIMSLILVSSLLTYTTTPSMLTTGLERLLKPLNKLHVPVSIFAMMMTLALRFVPTLIEEVDRIMNAQKARGSDLETGNFLKRAKAFVPVLVPLFISAFRRAAELANAMESRCYTGNNQRTSLKQLKIRPRDMLACALCAMLCAGVVILNGRFAKII